MVSTHRTSKPARVGFFAWVTDLVHANRARLFGIARREGLGSEDAFDCVQDVLMHFLDLPEARRLAAVPDDAARLLSVMVRNTARNRRRLHPIAKIHESSPELLGALADPMPEVEALLVDIEERLKLLGCINQLGVMQKAVVTLRMLDEQPGEKVAAILKTTSSNVAVMLHRAKGRLRFCMAETELAANAVIASARRRH